MVGLWPITFSALFVASPATPQASHVDEIRAYVTIAAVAQTASDRCPELLVSTDMLQRAPAFFHMTPEDEQNARFAYGMEMKRLASAIDAAPSLRIWCDAAYRAYGPDGDIIKGLLAK